jgi:hypothetical protein
MSAQNQIETPNCKDGNLLYRIYYYLIFLMPLLSIVALIIFYRSGFEHFNFYRDWSFAYSDKPWTPQTYNPVPIIGKHYFGDYLLPVSYLHTPHPYSLSYPLTVGVAPLALFILNCFDFFGEKSGFFLFEAVSLFIFGYSIYKGLRNKSRLINILITVIVVSFSLPIFIAIDRGNTILFSVGCAYYAYVYLKKDNLSLIRMISIAVATSAACSFKDYLLFTLALLFYLAKSSQKRKIIVWSAAFGLSSNVLFSFFYKSNPFEVLKNIYSYSQYQNGVGHPDWLLGGVSPMRTFLNLVLHSCKLSNNLCVAPFQQYSNVPALAFFTVILFLVIFSKLSTETKTILSLTTISLLPPVAMAYTLCWTPIALSICLDTWLHKEKYTEYFYLIPLLTFINIPNPLTGEFGWPFQDWRTIASTLILIIILFSILDASNRKLKILRTFQK